MAMKVYVAAGCLAAAGVALAAIDYSRRAHTIELKDQTNSAGKSGEVKPKETKPKESGPKEAGPKNVSPDSPKPVAGNGTKPETRPETKTGTTPEPVTQSGVKLIENLDPAALPMKIGVNEAWTLHSNGTQFIDGRKAEDFAAGHVPAALNIRALDIQSGGDTWRSFFTTADPSAWYVVYCDGGDCHESEQIRAFLIQAGFKNVLIYDGGYPGWIEAKLPTEKP